MNDKIYLILYTLNCLISLALGILSLKEHRYFKIFILYLVFYPTNYLIVSSYSRFNLLSFDFFLLPFWANFLGRLILQKRRNGYFLLQKISMACFILFYLAVLILNLSATQKVIYVAKDLKPFFYLFSLIILFDFKSKIISFSPKELSKILTIKFIFCLAMFLLVSFTSLPSVLSSDQVYESISRERMRYADFSLVLCVVLILNILRTSSSRKINYIYVISFLIIFLSGSRTILLFLVIATILSSMKKISLKGTLIGIATCGILALFFILLGNDESGAIERFTILGSKDLIIESLAIRFSPFIDAIKDFGPVQYLIGDGFGKVFFIPWFEFRENLDPYNIAIDNAYLTLFAKFGVLSFIYWILFLKIIKKATYSKWLLNTYNFFFLFSGITTSIFYQDIFGIYLFIIFYFIHIKNNQSVNLK